MLDDLLLLRVWAAPDAARGETRARAAADLRPIVTDPSEGRGAWQAAFGTATERLATAGFLTASGRQGARLHLTDAGRRRVQERFEIPAAGGTGRRRRTAGWAWWRDRHALPLALGGEHAEGAAELRGALLRRFYLPELSGHRRGGGSLAKTVDLLLARRLGVTRVSLGAFRQAALRDWVRQASPPEAAAEPARPAGRLPDAPASFAQAVLAAARRSPSGRFGENKVFVAHVWRELLAGGGAAPEEADTFKERLVRANTAGELHLSRADLAGAHDAADVRASEVEYLGEKFHFVRLD